MHSEYPPKIIAYANLLRQRFQKSNSGVSSVAFGGGPLLILEEGYRNKIARRGRSVRSHLLRRISPTDHRVRLRLVRPQIFRCLQPRGVAIHCAHFVRPREFTAETQCQLQFLSCPEQALALEQAQLRLHYSVLPERAAVLLAIKRDARGLGSVDGGSSRGSCARISSNLSRVMATNLCWWAWR